MIKLDTLDRYLCVDEPAYGLGAVLLQQANGSWKPITFATSSMTETEH